MTAQSNSANSQLPFRLQHFTDRDGAIAAFDALWDAGRSSPHFLAFDGISGVGKSTLVDFLIETRCKPRQMAYALIDFEGDTGLPLRTDWRSLLLELATQLHLHRHPAYVTVSKEAEAWFESVKQSLRVTITQSAGEGGQISQSPITANLDVAVALRKADERARHQTAGGLLDALEQTYYSADIALFFDTCELLEQAGDKAFSGWLWQWLKTATDRLPGLRVIAAGRNRLTGIPRRNREQRDLGPFSAEDSDRLLTSLGVTDAAWRSAVFQRLAYGHPLITEMAGNLWQDALKSGLPIAIEDIPALSGHEEAVSWLTVRILERLESPLKEVVRWGALLRRFNQDILAHTLPETVPALDDDTYEQLRRYSFVAPARVGEGLACHDLLRQVQNAYLRTHQPTAYREFHTRAASYFAGQGDPIETLYHRLMAGDDEAPQDWYNAVHAAYLHRNWAKWAALLDVAERPEQHPTSQHRAEVTFWRGQWHRWRYENEAALESYQAALRLFRAVGDRLGEANTLQAIGFMKLDTGDGEAGLNDLEAGLALYKQVGDRVGQANTYWGLGMRWAQEGRLQEAEALITQTLELVEQFIPAHPFTDQVRTVLEQVRGLLSEQG